MQVVGNIAAAVSAAQFKRAVHIIEGVTDDDALIADLLVAAQAVVEDGSHRLLTERDLIISARAKGWRRWYLPICPVVSVASVSVQGADGSFAVIASSLWRLELAADEPSIVFADGAFASDAPDGAIVQATLRAGSAAGKAPAQLTQAVVMLAKEWMDAGVSMEAAQAVPMGFGVKSLMRQARYSRPAEFAAV